MSVEKKRNFLLVQKGLFSQFWALQKIKANCVIFGGKIRRFVTDVFEKIRQEMAWGRYSSINEFDNYDPIMI